MTHLVNWLQDIYPEIAVELGIPFLKGPILKMISNLRDRSLKTAAANVVLGNHITNRPQPVGHTGGHRKYGVNLN